MVSLWGTRTSVPGVYRNVLARAIGMNTDVALSRYFPLAAGVMFWPYAVMPFMEYVQS